MKIKRAILVLSSHSKEWIANIVSLSLLLLNQISIETGLFGKSRVFSVGASSQAHLSVNMRSSFDINAVFDMFWDDSSMISIYP